MLQMHCLESSERTELLAHVREVHRGLAQFAEVFAPIQWTHHEALGKWTPAEIIEHTLLVENEILDEVHLHLADAPSFDRQEEMDSKEIILRRFLPNRGKARASDNSSRFSGLQQDDARAALTKSEEKLSDLLTRQSRTPLKAIMWNHAGFGPLSAYLWLLYIPLQSERHLNQLIQRFGFPQTRAQGSQ